MVSVSKTPKPSTLKHLSPPPPPLPLLLLSVQTSIGYMSIVGGTQVYRSASGQVRTILSAAEGLAYYEIHLDKAPSCISE